MFSLQGLVPESIGFSFKMPWGLSRERLDTCLISSRRRGSGVARLCVQNALPVALNFDEHSMDSNMNRHSLRFGSCIRSLFARATTVPRDMARKSSSVKHLNRLINCGESHLRPTQILTSRGLGGIARFRLVVSQGIISALTIRNPFSGDHLERARRAFSFSFIETSLEKRQLLATFSYSSGLLTVQTDSADEQLSIISLSEAGNYTITTSGAWSGTAVSGLSNTSTDLYVNQPSGLASILVNDNGGTVSNSSFRFGLSSTNFVNNLTVNFTNATSGVISVGNAASFINGKNLNLTTTGNQITVSNLTSANSTGSIRLTGRNIVVTGNITTEAGDISLTGNNGSYQTGTFDGVQINGAAVNVNTTSGNITIDGRGGLNTVYAGVNLQSSKVQAGGSGCVTITGVSGNGTDNAYGIYASGSTVTTSSGSLSVNGSSCGTGFGTLGVYLASSANISATGAGNVTITGTANGTHADIGINVNGSKVTTNSGSITVNGTSYGTDYQSSGVVLGSSNISATGTGNVTITGTAANGTYSARGIYVSGSSVTTSSGSIAVNGTSCGTTTDSKGVDLDSSSNISATGVGNVTIIGSANGMHADIGININGSRVTTNSGSLTVNGTSYGTTTDSKGVYLFSSTIISATGVGNVTITGTAACGTDGALGIKVSQSSVTTSSGAITVNGTSCGTGTGSTGVSLSTSANISATGAGNVTITGSTSLNFSNFTGINSYSSTANIYSNGGLIILTANSANLRGTVNATTAGDVMIQTLGSGVDLGDGTDTSAKLGLSQAEINRITANLLTIGNSTTGNIAISANIAWPTHLTLNSGTLISGLQNANTLTQGSSNITSTGLLTVTPLSYSIGITTSSPVTYGTNVILTATLTHSGTSFKTGTISFYNNGSLLGTGSITSDVATYSWAGAGAATYANITSTGNVTFAASNGSNTAVVVVNRYSLSVTANAQTKVYGNAVPLLTYTNATLVNGDSGSVFSGNLATTGTANSGVGNNTITQGNLSAGANYSISYTSANLSVTAYSLSVTADAQTKVYGAAVPALSYTNASLVNGDSGSVFSGDLTTTGTANSGVGNNTITQGNLSAGANYSISYTSANLAVTAYSISISANNQTKAYGAALPSMTYTNSTLVNGDTSSIFSGSLATTATANSPGGYYPIAIGSLTTNSNYSVSSFSNGILSESEQYTTTVTTSSDTNDPYDDLVSLREAISYVKILTGVQSITFALSVFTSNAATITLTQGPLTINNTTGNLSVQGPLAASGNLLTISGNDASGIFKVFSIVTIDNMTLSNGTGANGTSPNLQGGAIYSNGTLGLTNVTINHSTANFGSAIYQAGGSLTIHDSNITNAIIVSNNGTLAINGSQSLALGQINACTLIINSTSGDITQQPGTNLAVSGTANLVAFSDIILANTTNDFGTFQASGFNITVKDATDIVFGSTTATGNLTAIALGGGISQAGAIRVSGNMNLTASGAITLADSLNDFQAVSANGTDITLTDSNNITLGAITPRGDFLVTSSHIAITSNISNPGHLQFYTGAVINSGGARTLTANNVNISSTLNGTDSAFTITGNTNITGSIANMTSLTTTENVILGNSVGVTGTVSSLQVGGSANLNSNVITIGPQSYNGSVILNGNAILTTTNSDIQFGGTLSGNSYNLDITTGTGNVSFGNNVSGISNVTFNSANQISATGAFQAAILFLNNGTLNANTGFTTSLKVNGGTAHIQSAGSLTGNANLVSGSLISANLITGTLTINGGSANMQTGAITTGLATLAAGNLTSNAAFNGGLTATGGTLYTTHNGTTTTTLILANGSTWNASGANYTSDFSRISANTAVTIGSTANLTLAAAPMKALQNFTLINNTAVSTISGTFAGLPQGIDHTSNGMPLRFNYSGGTGFNDLVLTDYPTRLTIISGQNQTAANGVVYASNLTIQVLGGTNNATPVDGAHVIFTLPGQLLNMNIASGYFNGVNDSANLTANVLTGTDGNSTIQLWGGVNAGPFNIQPVVAENANAKDLNNGVLTMPVTYNLGVVGLSLQKQSINRSNVRYLDLVLADPASIPDLAALNSNIVLQKIRSASMSGGANITASNITLTSLNAVKTTVGWTFDFGTGGIGTGGADAIEADGVYQFANMTGSPSVGLPRSYRFHRLLGDANGDQTVNAADTALVNTLTSTLAWRYNSGLATVPQGELFYIGSTKWAGDMNGDGRVNATDLNITGRWRGRRVNYNY